MQSPFARLAAAHNARQEGERLGRVVEGSLAEGNTQVVQLSLGPRCTTISLFGAESVREMSISVRDSQGNLLSGATARDQQPSVHVCPPQAGPYAVSLTMNRGSGTFVLGTWQEDGGAQQTQRAIASDGTCRAPFELELGSTVHGSTADGRSMHANSCSNDEFGVRANELVYHLRVQRRTALTLAVEAEWKSVLSVRGQCGDVESERACTAPGTQVDRFGAMGVVSPTPTPTPTPASSEGNNARLSLIAEPGNYFIIVDGREGESGEFVLSSRADAVPSENERCQSAPMLSSGTPVDGNTVGEFDFFHASCGGHARGPDRTYRLELTQRSRVQVELRGSQFQSAMHIHDRCSRSDDEVACEAQGISSTSDYRLNATLDPGMHYVVVDGVASPNAGPYTVEATVVPAGGAPMSGDRCVDAIPLVPSTPTQGNTLGAHDDVEVPCGAAQNGLDQVFRLDLAERSLVRASLSGDFRENGALHFTRSCDGPQDRSMCRSHALEEESALTRILPAGTHYLVVESAHSGEFGKFTINADVSSAAGIESVCANARPLVSGRTIEGVNRGRGTFDGSCAGADNSPETVFRLNIDRPSEVELNLTRVATRSSAGGDSVPYEPAIYVRRECFDPYSELECRESGDDGDSVNMSFEATRGTYYVFVDGAAHGAAARWRLRTEIRPE